MIDASLQDDLYEVEKPRASRSKLWTTLVLFVLLVAVVFVVIKNPFDAGIATGQRVSVEYTSYFPDGVAFEKVGPVEFIAGAAPIVAMDDALSHMKPGETVRFDVVPAEEGLGGYYDPNMVKSFPKAVFDAIGQEVVTGKNYDLGNVSGVVLRLEGAGEATMVVVDLNKQETYQTLTYELTLLEVLDTK